MIRTARALSFAVIASGILVAGAYERSTAQGVGLTADQSAERWVCRRAADATTQNATMSNADRTALICRPLRIEARMSDNTTMLRIGSVRAKPAPAAPELSNALTASQVNDAWARFVMQQLGEGPFTGGG
jgi:hypothetical protein